MKQKQEEKKEERKKEEEEERGAGQLYKRANPTIPRVSPPVNAEGKLDQRWS